MPNIAAVLKEEIRRLARKEVKTSTKSTKQAVAQYRRDIAGLKRLVQSQQKRIAFFLAQSQKQGGQPPADEEPLVGRPLFGPIGAGTTETPRAVGRGLRPVGGRLGTDDLQLGARQGSAAQGPACRPDRRPGNWQAGIAETHRGDPGTGREQAPSQERPMITPDLPTAPCRGLHRLARPG